MTLPLHIQYDTALEETIDAIIETVLADSHVEYDTDNEGPPVSSETWLSVKAHVLALLATMSGNDIVW